jgi:hypothetical protein
MLKVIGGLVGVLLAVGIMATQGVITEGADTTAIGVENQSPEAVKPEWTPEAAATWVQHNIRVSLENCLDHMCFYEDQVLYAFNWQADGTPLPARFKRSTAELISDSDAWTAYFYEDCRCWLVEGRFHQEDEYGYPFWSWESNSWVESAAYNEHYGG